MKQLVLPLLFVLAGCALFDDIMGGGGASRYPKIGSRAFQVESWDGDTIVFTTTDGKYDVEISRTFIEGAFVNTRDLAQDISNLYDKEMGLLSQPSARTW